MKMHECMNCGKGTANLLIKNIQLCDGCMAKKENAFNAMSGPFCIDCKNSSFGSSTYECMLFRDMVGYNLKCADCRVNEHLCGEDAKYYEEGTE